MPIFIGSPTEPGKYLSLGKTGAVWKTLSTATSFDTLEHAQSALKKRYDELLIKKNQIHEAYLSPYERFKFPKTQDVFIRKDALKRLSPEQIQRFKDHLNRMDARTTPFSEDDDDPWAIFTQLKSFNIDDDSEVKMGDWIIYPDTHFLVKRPFEKLLQTIKFEAHDLNPDLRDSFSLYFVQSEKGWLSRSVKKNDHGEWILAPYFNQALSFTSEEEAKTAILSHFRSYDSPLHPVIIKSSCLFTQVITFKEQNMSEQARKLHSACEARDIESFIHQEAATRKETQDQSSESAPVKRARI